MEAEEIVSQWCTLHDKHQDDPRHDYTDACEEHLRASWPGEDAAVLRRWNEIQATRGRS